ncbi:MAG: caspase family protein, partial [Chitinophagaceae bacterium]
MYYKMIIIFLLFIFYFQITDSEAQNKYAVVIGINEYYEMPGVTGAHNLKGCVNDAISIRSLLLNRFGFDQSNITTLFNAQATQRNMTAALQNILQKGKKGDAVVFYFCGHGIYMSNPANLSDPLKKGYNQALCMSDLYAPNLECLVKDNTLKK